VPHIRECHQLGDSKKPDDGRRRDKPKPSTGTGDFWSWESVRAAVDILDNMATGRLWEKEESQRHQLRVGLVYRRVLANG
jgi:hypothetical protein